MTFSQRTRWDLTSNRLSAILEEKRRSGVPLVDLTESNPTRAGLTCPANLLAPLASAAALVYEPVACGLEAARAAVASDYSRRGFDVGPDRMVLTASTSEAYAFLFKLLCDPGDAVLVPRPSYPLFEYLARLESVQVDRYALEYDGEWHLDAASIEAAIGPRTRAVVLVNPNNPTGSYLKRGEVEGLLELCARHGLAVISDEVFADYAFTADPRCVTSLAKDGPALTFSLGGLSKSAGLPQLKLGWLAVTGPPALRQEALRRLEVVADTYLSVATPVQRAAPELLGRIPELQAPIRARVKHNLAALARRLAPSSPATLLTIEGGWYAVLQVPATEPEEERVVRLLTTCDVLVHPGYFFDFQREAFLVLSLLPLPEAFALGVGRLLADVSA